MTSDQRTFLGYLLSTVTNEELNKIFARVRSEILTRAKTLQNIRYLTNVLKIENKNYYPQTPLTPCSTVLLEKLTVSQLVNKLPAYCGTREFITGLTSARHMSLS